MNAKNTIKTMLFGMLCGLVFSCAATTVHATEHENITAAAADSAVTDERYDYNEETESVDIYSFHDLDPEMIDSVVEEIENEHLDRAAAAEEDTQDTRNTSNAGLSAEDPISALRTSPKTPGHSVILIVFCAAESFSVLCIGIYFLKRNRSR